MSVDTALAASADGGSLHRDGPPDGTSDRTGRGVLAVVFALGLALRLAVAVLPERLLLRVTIDDALYYVGVAQEVVAGNGSSFDGIHPTNGYHPLWLLLITPFTALSGGGTGLIRLLVLVQTALGAATFLLVARLLGRRLGRRATAFGLAVWWLTPMSVLTSQTGVETSLACFAVALTVLAAVRYAAAPSVRGAALLGAAAGVAFLARSDTAFATLAVGVWVLLRTRPARSPRTWPWRDAAVVAASGLLVVLPWLIWNLVRFGTIEQASTWARPMVMWDLLEREGATTGEPLSRAATAAGEAADHLLRTWPVVLGWTPLALLAAALGASWAVKRNGWSPDRDRGGLALLGGCLLVAGTALAAVHSGIRLVPREYYFEWVRMGLGILAAGVAAGVSVAAARRSPTTTGPRPAGAGAAPAPQRVLLALVAGVALIAGGRTVALLRSPAFPWQESMVEAGRWLREHTDPDDRVLSFNAGIISHYSERSVINLDGVIDNAALDALESRELARFMCDSGARWYVDFEPIMLDEHRGFLGSAADRIVLEPVTEIRAGGATRYRDSELIVHRFSCEPG